MRIFFLLGVCLALTAFQCDDEVEDNERSVIKGFVLDNANNPQNSIVIQVEQAGLIIGDGTSNANGEFNFVSLRSGTSDFKIVVNPNTDPEFASIEYRYENLPFEEEYDLGSIGLPKLADLDFSIENTSGTSSTLSYVLTYQTPDCIITFDENGIIIFDNCFATFTENGNLDSANPNFSKEINSIQNSTVLFTYSINSNAAQTISIQLTQANSTYVFEY